MKSKRISLRFSEINLNNCCEVNKVDQLNRTPLMLAAQRGNTHNVYQLVKHKASIHRTDNNGKTALMYAAECGMTGTASILLRRGAKINATDSRGKTALMYAAQHGFPRTCRLLLSYHARPNMISNDQHKTALLYASFYGNYLDQQILQDVSDMAKGPIDLINMPDLNSILSAVFQRRNRYECIKMLVNYGAQINHADSNNKTALMYLAMSMKSSIFEILESKGLSCNFNNSIPRNVYEDVNSGFKAFRYLITHGADIHCDDKSGHNLNHYLHQLNDPKVLAYFSAVVATNTNNHHNQKSLSRKGVTKSRNHRREKYQTRGSILVEGIDSLDCDLPNDSNRRKSHPVKAAKLTSGNDKFDGATETFEPTDDDLDDAENWPVHVTCQGSKCCILY